MRCALLAIFLVAIQTQNLFADIILFSDGEFNPSFWSTTTSIGGTTGTQSGSQVLSNGNPGSNWQVITTSSLAVYSAHLNNTFVYDPSEGAITAIDFSIDFNNVMTFGQGMEYGVLLVQDGDYYVKPGPVSGGAPNWQNKSYTSLTAASFGKIPSNETPDFSTNGTPITFGFYTYNSAGNGMTVAYDNYQMTLTTAAAIPEPSAFLLTLVGIVGVAARRRFRRAAPLEQPMAV